MKKGFTLIELLIVIAIIGILPLIGFASYTSINKRSRDAKRKSDLEQVRSALEMYRTDNGSYPGTGTGFNLLSTELPVLVPTYMPTTPTDPTSTYNYYYSALTPLGTPPKYYGYCICASLESDTTVSNPCGVTPIANCTYYLKNP